MTILEAIEDPNLFGREFGGLEWRVLVAALFGLPMSPEELEVYRLTPSLILHQTDR